MRLLRSPMGRMSHRWLGFGTAVAFALVCALAFPGVAYAAAVYSSYRLYNPNSGEHFYTTSSYERDYLSSVGWSYEGKAWSSTDETGIAVWRVYNPNAGDHHYTTSKYEYDQLVKVGWAGEGIGWYSSAASDGEAVYRLYNPNAKAGAHHFTTSAYERDSLVKVGWKYEGVAWYGMASEATTPIMSSDTVGAAKMATFYRSVVGESSYPSSVYAQYGVSTIDQFCSILVEEAKAEGVCPDVVFVQAMLETNYLRFGGDVKVGQCNFCGLGATGGGVPGIDFTDEEYADYYHYDVADAVRIGLRAQVQHLKAYASTESLKNSLVDSRFGYVERGIAPNVEDLGNGNWAGDKNYSTKLLNLLAQLRS